MGLGSGLLVVRVCVAMRWISSGVGLLVWSG